MHRFELHNGILQPAPGGDGEIALDGSTQLVVRVDVQTSTKPLLLDCAVWNNQPMTWRVGTSMATQSVVLGSGGQHLTVVLLPTKKGLFSFGISVVAGRRASDGAALQSCEISQLN